MSMVFLLIMDTKKVLFPENFNGQKWSCDSQNALCVQTSFLIYTYVLIIFIYLCLDNLENKRRIIKWGESLIGKKDFFLIFSEEKASKNEST